MLKQPPTLLLFDANAPTLKNDYAPAIAQVKSDKYRKTNSELLALNQYPTVTRHIPNCFSAAFFISSFGLFFLNKKKFNPEPIAHVFSSYGGNCLYYEYRLYHLLQATRQPTKDMLAKIQAHVQRIEQANELAKKRGHEPAQVLEQILELRRLDNCTLAEALCRAVFGYMGYYYDLQKHFLHYEFANGLDCQIYHLTRYLELLDTLPEYEHLPEAQRDEQLRVIFSDYLNIK